MPHIDQLDKKLTSAIDNSAASETPVANENSSSGQHFLLVPNHAGRPLGIFGNVGDGEDMEDWRRSALQLEPRASLTSEGSLRELQVIDCLSETESYELFDNECPRLEQATSIDPQDQRRYELVTRRSQNAALR